MSKDFLNILVTTTDDRHHYRVISPVFTQLSNKTTAKGSFYQLKNKYSAEIAALGNTGLIRDDNSFGNLFYQLFTPDVGQTDFDTAFHLAILELQRKAYEIGADAVIGMRMDFDLDTTGIQYFYLQMYGTAIEYLDNNGLSKRERVRKYWREHQAAYDALIRQIRSLNKQMRRMDEENTNEIQALQERIDTIQEELTRDR